MSRSLLAPEELREAQDPSSWFFPNNQYFVGVQYFEEDIDSVETLLDVPITGLGQDRPVPLRQIATLRRSSVPTEITHNNFQSTIDLTMGVSGRDLGHVADDVARVVARFGVLQPDGSWIPYDPQDHSPERKVIKGAMIELSGEYSRMQETFSSLGFGLILATLLIYFLMAALFSSYLTPLVILCRRAAGAGGGDVDALSHQHGDQCPVAPGRDLHGRHRGFQHGSDG